MNRRELFSSLTSKLKDEKLKKSVEVLRPPYNKDDSLFIQECHKCEAKCATVCEEEIIKIADDATPYLVFGKNGCTFCDDCALACEFDVLKLEDKDNIQATVDISVSACISWHGVMCFSCKDPCLENAIVFQALFKPVIDMQKCTSCGFCISLCPTNAIEMEFTE